MDFSLSDLKAALGDNNGTFGGGGLLLVVILFLFFVMFGGGWGNNQRGDLDRYATAASQQEILFGQQFGQINDRLTNIGNGICNLGYEMQGGFGQLGKEVALGQSNLNQAIMGTGNALSRQLGDCCCENRLAVANLGAQMDRQTCEITTAIKAEAAATRAMLQEDTIQRLRDQVADLRMDNRMQGVVRYPNGYSYNAGPSPFCGGCCNG